MTIAYETDFNKLAESIHADNVKAGWWTDIITGTSLLPYTREIDGAVRHCFKRNPGELLALVHSEISEAIEADILNIKDSHLTDQRGVLVEIADAAIRIFDIVGAYRFNLKPPSSPIDFTDDELRLRKSHDDSLPYVNIWVSRALEGFRKNKMDVVRRGLNAALNALMFGYDGLGLIGEPDFFKMIQLKREYNLHRADHKIENRLKDDGKKI